MTRQTDATTRDGRRGGGGHGDDTALSCRHLTHVNLTRNLARNLTRNLRRSLAKEIEDGARRQLVDAASRGTHTCNAKRSGRLER